MNTATTAGAIGFNPRDPSFRANPYPAYHALRCHDPIHFREERKDWLITRYSDVAALLKDSRFGGVEPPAGPQGMKPAAHRVVSLGQESAKLLNLMLPNRNPPDHTRLRQLFSSIFAPNQVARLEGRIEALINASIDRALPQGEMDIIHDLSAPLSSTIICEIMGIPEAERPLIEKMAIELSYLIDIDLSPMARVQGLLAMMGLTEYFRGLLARWQSHPPEHGNLITMLLQARAQGDLSEEELLANCNQILLAGYGATRYLIGNGVLALLRHPEQWQLLRAHPELRDSAIDELLRYDAPAQLASRVALTDVELAGQTIQQGQPVQLLIGAANRDPAVFEAPDRLDIRRNSTRHLSFGHGIHYCLGAALSRMETRLAIGTLAHRLPQLRLQTDADTLEWEGTFVGHGLKSLPVAFG